MGLAEIVAAGASGSTNSPYLQAPVLEVADVSDARPDPRADSPSPGGAPQRTEVIDSDVDLQAAAQRRETRPRQWDLLAVIALGGVLGAEARHGVDVALPHGSSGFPWSTLLVNASGSLILGAVMVLLLELTSPHRLVRPFLGVGVLGGYTTYCTFAVDTERLVHAHRPAAALAYVVLTVVACLVAVVVASMTTKAVGEAIIAARTRKARARRRRT